MGEPITFPYDEIAPCHLLAAPQSAGVPSRPPCVVRGSVPGAHGLCGPLSVCMSPGAPPEPGCPTCPPACGTAAACALPARRCARDFGNPSLLLGRMLSQTHRHCSVRAPTATWYRGEGPSVFQLLWSELSLVLQKHCVIQLKSWFLNKKLDLAFLFVPSPWNTPHGQC